MAISKEVFIEQINKAYQVVQQVQVIIATINKMIIDEGVNEGDITALKSSVSKVQSDIVSINNSVNTINTSLSTQSGQISNINSNISTLNSSINTLRNDLDNLVNVVNSLQTSKQDTLVSGSNIKKINITKDGVSSSNDLLGSGSIDIECDKVYTHHIKIAGNGTTILGDLYIDFVSSNSQPFTMSTFLKTFDYNHSHLSDFILNFYGLWNGDSTILECFVTTNTEDDFGANLMLYNVNTLQVTEEVELYITKNDKLEDTVIHF